MKKVLVISSSLRKNSNSEQLAVSFAEGAKSAGHETEVISLQDKEIKYCVGCLACQKTQRCFMHDDADAIREKMLHADVLVFATPIYYYEMSGILKTMLDRANPLYPSDYRFREVYALAAAAEDEEHVPEKAFSGIEGWVDCFEMAKLVGTLFCGGVTAVGEIKDNPKLKEAYDMGRNI
ncbi:flavodoxin family protein [Ruminococcus flavefaciens]|uniref:flavodoxin family protein n=1 Tax=Ruminococcus flavefaciens TaxID=1265 RepID=UPI00048B7F9F|nr:flavodoxin family protein [Ruminococcus flavefaciens]